MGFLDKLKSVRNMVTGGGATVTLEVEEPSRTQPFRVHIKAVVADSDINPKRVYLKIRSVERVRVINVPVPIEKMVDGERRIVGTENGEYTQETTLFSGEFDVAGGATLPANSEHQWNIEVSLPDQAIQTYLGENASHEWEFFAGLDTFGNDPDSGWVAVEIP